MVYPTEHNPNNYVIPEEEQDIIPDEEEVEEDGDYFRQRAGLEPDPQEGVLGERKQEDVVPKPEHISFYYPTSGGQITLPAGDTSINFIEGNVSQPNGKSDTLSSRLSGSPFSTIGALFIVADKSFVININGVAQMTVEKNFKKKHVSIQRINISVSSSTNILLWASTDPDADFEKDINEVTVAGGVSPLGGVVTAGEADLDTNTWTAIASRTINNSTTYRLTKAQVQCGSACWGCVILGNATVAVFRVPDDGYWVDWFPYGDAVKMTGDGALTATIKAKSKAAPVTAYGVLFGEETT